MRIFAYRIAQQGPRPLVDICTRLKALGLENRFFGGNAVRLEDSEERDGILLMDFARERGGHGPGRMSRAAALSEIPLNAGESFGEDTGIAFDPTTGYAAVQYNHFGPRVSAVENYLYAFDLSLGGLPPREEGVRDEDRFGFRFGSILKLDANARLQRLGIIHEVGFEISIPAAQTAELEAGRSVGDVLRAPLPGGVETISVTLKAEAGRDGSLGHAGVMGIVNDLNRIGQGVRRAMVRGRPTRDDPIDKIDLIEERISKDEDLPLGAGRRFSRADRWSALHRALGQWLLPGALI